MNTGSCLCGSVTWQFTGDAEATYNCHCAMCRKAHGAAFGTYYFVNQENFKWTGSRETLTDYQSSDSLIRAFCGSCGSVVPNADGDGKSVTIPAGCHDQGSTPDCHIFVASKAPWLEITDDLPCHDAYPPGENLAEFDDKPLSAPEEGVVRGSCLCDAIAFEVVEPFTKVYNCHCQRCRRARAAAFTTNGFTSDQGVKFIRGEQHLASYKLPDAKYFTQVFCEICGSGMPRVDNDRQLTVVPLGSLDDDPGQIAKDHIYTASKAEWYSLAGAESTFEEMPT
jgi:hypothetical protein